MRILRVSAVLCVGAAMMMAIAGGCSQGKCAGCGEVRECGSTAHCKSFKGTPTTINKMCLVMTEDPVDPAVKPVVWKGTEYGLCCEGCRPKWEKLSDAQKGAAVAKALSVSQ